MIKSFVEKYPKQIFWCIFGSVLTLFLLAMTTVDVSSSQWYTVVFAYFIMILLSMLSAVCVAFSITSIFIIETGANVPHGFIFRIWFGDERE